MRKKLSTSNKEYNNILKCLPELEELAKLKGKKRMNKVKEVKSCVISAISQLAKKCLKNKIYLKQCDFDKLKKYQDVLRSLSKRSKIEEKREIISQKGGFLPLLIPPALSMVAGIVGNEISKLLDK